MTDGATELKDFDKTEANKALVKNFVEDILLNGNGAPADISVSDLACAIADDTEKKAHLFERFTVAEA